MPDPITRLNAALEGRYRIERELGEGGMATVYLADDLKHERRVALKVLKPELAAVVGGERFLAEIKTTANLQHPHILPLFDSGEADGFLFYVMPYVEGETLRDRIDREKQLPVDDAVRIASDVAEALDYAHSHGVIHRDIKPANILMSKGRPLVADFGIAGTVGDDHEHRLTETGLVVGTARYMSPEQATGSASLDGRTDVYSLGWVLYEALVGRAPFANARAPVGVLARMMTEDPSPVSQDRPAAAGLEPILAKARARVAADRYGTAGEFARALRSSTPAQGPPAAVGTGSAGREPSPRAHGSRGWRKAAVAGGLAVAAVSALVWMNGRDPELVSAGGAVPPPTRPSLAALPFRNLSPDADDAYFAAGIYEEIRTQLSKVDGIKLVAGPSLVQYMETDRPSSEIADELGVSTLLQGSVRRAGNEVMIAVQLYDVAGNEQLWGQSYERELADVFQIQTEVATRVVEELRSVLTPEERAELERRPPANPQAYAQFLRGQANYRTFFAVEGARAAAEAYGRAVELDPDYAAAWSGLVQARLQLAWLWGDPESRPVARSALDRLAELAPASTELRQARGLWFYFGEQRFEEALLELEAVAVQWPGDVNVLTYLGASQRRLGRWEESVRSWERVLELDPLNAGMASNLAQISEMMRRFDDAERYGRRSVALGPEVPVHWWHLVNTQLLQGEIAAARVVVDSAGLHLGRQRLESEGWWALWQVFTGNLPQVLDVYRDVYSRDPQTLDGTWGRAYDLGIVGAAAAGDAEIVRGFAGSIRASAEDALSAAPAGDARIRSNILSQLALAAAYLGDEGAAVRFAQDAVETYPVSRDAVQGTDHIQRLAQVYAIVGRQDEAVDRLRYLLSIPSQVSVGLLRISPRWYMLRTHSGFQSLLAEPG